MKYFVGLICLLFTLSLSAQRDLTPNSKKSAFGKRDLRSLANYGLQFQLGATYLLTKPRNQEFDLLNPQGELRATYLHDEFGRLGGFRGNRDVPFPKETFEAFISA